MRVSVDVIDGSPRAPRPRFDVDVLDVAEVDEDTAPSLVPEPAPLLAKAELFSPSGIEVLPLWEERWPARELAKIRDRGLRAFQRSHGQRPISDEEAIFLSTVVDACMDRSLTLGNLPTLPKARWQIVAGIDPAAGGESKLSAFWVLIVLAVDQNTGHKYVLWIDRVRGTEIDDHKRIIARTYASFRWSACNLERNNVQRLLLAPYKTTGAPIILSQTTAEKHFQFEMIADEMHAGKLHIPMSPRMQPLLDEMKQYPTGRYHDCLEALRLAWLLADTPRKGTGGHVAVFNIDTGQWSS